MPTLICFGNPYLDYDRSAILLVNELRTIILSFGVEIKFLKDPFLILDEFEQSRDKNIIIIDSADIKRMTIVSAHELDRLRFSEHTISLHDFDLNFLLPLLNRLEVLDKNKIKLSIIAIPMDFYNRPIKEQEKMKQELIKYIKSLTSN